MKRVFLLPADHFFSNGNKNEKGYLIKKKSSTVLICLAFLLRVNLLHSQVHHCVKRVRIRNYSGQHFARIFSDLAIQWCDCKNCCLSLWRRYLDTEYISVFTPNAGKCGKNADQNNSKYDFFLRSASFKGFLIHSSTFRSTYFSDFLTIAAWNKFKNECIIVKSRYIDIQ